MALPVEPPIAPMLARLERELPEVVEGTVFEPKWDGFRGVVFRDDDALEIVSRGERSFTRFFPELRAPLLETLPLRAVVDGEIVVPGPNGLDFALLQQRIHPATSRIDRLAHEIPASFVAFDLVALDERDLRDQPFSIRRGLLEHSLERAAPPVHLTPATTDRRLARAWLDRFAGRGLDGVMVKPPDLRYLEGERAMVKVKREHTADCVVGGYRLHTRGDGVGSLLLGLYDRRGDLHHVGVASGMRTALRSELLDVVRSFGMEGYDGHPWESWTDERAHETRLMPGTPSRWSRGERAAWIALRPELVAEVRFEQLQGPRFRHPARFSRWRPDRDPRSCTYAQLVAPVPDELGLFLDGAPRPPGSDRPG